MVQLPQISFRGKAISYEQFHDLLIIGTSGLSDNLMTEGDEYAFGGMFNYKIVAERLGLIFDDSWLSDFMNDMDNRMESLLSFDCAPDDQEDNGYWAYHNSGFTRIGALLKEKYYIKSAEILKTYEEFKHAFIIDLASLVEGGVGDEGQTDDLVGYDIHKTLNFIGVTFPDNWVVRLEADLIDEGVLVEVRDEVSRKASIYNMTREGYSYAQKLSNQYGADGFLLATFGESKLYFTVDASHISRLGLELVAKQETAVAELVKNGYDADATNVDLIVNVESEVSYLEILDNGSGMSLSELESGFMRLSTQSKVTNPVSKIFKRQKAGRKGIGRFAAQRLGKKLVLVTSTKESEFGLQLEINWEEFEAQQTLSSVPNSVKRIAKPFPHGTKLTILDLRDNWTDAQIARSYRHISELIQPFPLSKIADGEEKTDIGFKASFAREANDDISIIADDWTQYFNHALAKIDAVVDEKGRASWSLKSDKFKIDIVDRPIGADKENPTLPYTYLKGIQFRVFYFIDKEIQKSVRSKVANKLTTDGGVRLYRNGFRVLPYGDRYDDWLKLNASNRMRSILPPHSNRNFLGFVQITDLNGICFEETSSREGLVENDSFAELKDFISSTLKTAVLPIADARDKESTTTKTRQHRRTPKGQAEEILKRLVKLQEKADNDPQYAGALSEVLEAVRESVIVLGDTGESILQELEMMRVLASLGITIGEFTHEISLSMEAIKSSVNFAFSENKEMAKIGNEKISTHISDFEGYLNYFDNTIRENVSRELEVLEVRDVVKSFLRVLKPKIQRQKLVVFDKYNGHALFMKPMHKSEWSSILINLFTNSLKAIQRAGVKGKIGIVCGRKAGNVFLEFMDNGDGIETINVERVFDPFFTTTIMAGTSSDEDNLSGMGLGLKIVHDIVSSAKGSIFLKPAVEGFTTCFRVEIPEASDEEMTDDVY